MSQDKDQQRREKIIKAAASVFAVKGIHETSIVGITKKAQVPQSAFYDIFRTKEDLLAAIPEKALTTLALNMSNHLKFVKGAGNRLRFILHMMADTWQKNPDIAAVFVRHLKHSSIFANSPCHRPFTKITGLITTTVEQGVAKGRFKPDTSPYIVKAMILGAIEHLVTDQIMGSPETIGPCSSLEKTAGTIIDTIVRGIEAKTDLPGQWIFNPKSLASPLKDSDHQALADAKQPPAQADFADDEPLSQDVFEDDKDLKNQDESEMKENPKTSEDGAGQKGILVDPPDYLASHPDAPNDQEGQEGQEGQEDRYSRKDTGDDLDGQVHDRGDP